MLDENCRHVIMMSLASMLLMGTSQILRFVVVSIEDIQSEKFSGIGFRYLTVIYSAVIIASFLVPFFIYATSPKFAMITGCATYTLFVISLISPVLEILYLTSVIFGVGSVLIGTAQGVYLVKTSTKSTISKHCAIYWTIIQISVFLAGTVVYLRFVDEERIDHGGGAFVIGILFVFSITSIVFVALLPNYTEGYTLYKSKHKTREMHHLFSDVIKTLRSPIILLLCIPFFFLGFYIVFITVNYSLAVGHCTQLERPKALAHFVAIFIGLGEISGGGLLIVAAVYTTSSHRIIKITIGFVLLTTAHFMVFINLPNESSEYDTDDTSVIDPSASMVIGTSYLLGIADSCFNTQLIESLAISYPRYSAVVFSVFELFQALGVIAATAVSAYTALYGVIAFLVGLSLTTIICFIITESLINDETIYPKTKKASNEHSSDTSQDNSSRTTSRPTTSSSGTSKSRFSSRSSTTTMTESGTLPTTPQEPIKVTVLSNVRKRIMNCVRKIFKYPKDTSPDLKESGMSPQSSTSSKVNSSVQGDVMSSKGAPNLSRSQSRVSIVLPNSHPSTHSIASQLRTKLSKTKIEQIPEQQEQPEGFFKKLMSIPIKVPWLGVDNASKQPTDNQKPLKQIYPKDKAVLSSISLRSNSSKNLSSRSTEQFGVIDQGDIPNKGILRMTRDHRTP